VNSEADNPPTPSARSRRGKAVAVGGLLVGLALLVGLVVWQGVGEITDLVVKAGWPLLAVCVFAVPDQLLGAEAWRRLFPTAHRPRPMATWMASWMGSAVNTLLPVATIGGEVVKARLITLWGGDSTYAAATMIVDKTAQAIVVLVWGVIGIALLAAVAEAPEVVVGALIGAALLAAGIGGFVWVQIKGALGFVTRTASSMRRDDKWSGIVDASETVDARVRETYGRPGAVAAACALRLAGRIAMVGEVLLVAHLMGFEVSLMEAVLLKGVVYGVRGVAFVIPGGFGVQEGGFIAVGALIGLPADFMLAVSLAIRAREMLPSIPFLIAWQVTESRHHLKQRTEEAD